MCEERWKWVKLCENATSPVWKKHQNLPSNNNDAQGITKYGFLVRLDAQIVALCCRPPSGGKFWVETTRNSDNEFHQ